MRIGCVQCIIHVYIHDCTCLNQTSVVHLISNVDTLATFSFNVIEPLYVTLLFRFLLSSHPLPSSSLSLSPFSLASSLSFYPPSLSLSFLPSPISIPPFPPPPLSQVILMRDHPHENIVQFHDSYLVQDELWVVMEHMDGGALTNIVQRTR